jgi:hypothetical protein
VYINRAKALLLVGTISAGCASGSDDEGPDNPGAAGTAGAGRGGTSSAGTGGTGGTGGGAAGTGGTSSAGTGGAGGSAAGTGGTSSTGNGGTGGTPSVDDPDAGDPDASAPDAGAPDGFDAGGDGGTLVCDDSAGTVVTCDDLGQGDCSGQEGFLSSECEMIAFIMKPATANAARNCMLALDPPDLCDPTNTYACLAEALGSSCSDPEADDECTAIGAICDEQLPAFNQCSAALSGMTQEGRDQMVECMTTQVCDLYACIEGLYLP